MKKVLSLALALIMVFGSVPLAAFSDFNLNEIFPLSAITAEAATVVVITTGDANPDDMDTWLDIDSDRVKWTCSSSSVKSYRYTVVEVDKNGQKVASPLVELKLTTNNYFKLSSLSGVKNNALYKVWVGCYTDSSGNTILQGDGGCVAYFCTNTSAPTVSTGKASNIGDTYATLSGTLEKNGGASVSDHGFVVSTSSSRLTLTKGNVYSLGSAGGNKGTFTRKITDLSCSKTYYFAYYAQNEKGVEYGDSASFTTTCSHSSTSYVVSTNHTVGAVSVSDTEHQYKCYYDEICSECDVTLREAYRYEEKIEPHEFDEAGKCLDCGYAKGCAHKDPSREYYDERYNIIDSKTHEYVRYYKLVCDDCGADVDTKAMADTTIQNHSFLRNECTKCGYVKNQALSVTLTTDSAKANVNTNFGATAQATGGAGGYQYTHSVFNEKNEELRYLSYSEVTRFSYNTAKPGKYYFKVTVKDADGTTATATSDMITVVCPHETYDIDKFNITSTLEYEQYSDSQHYSVWYYNHDCKVCGYRYKEHVTDDENKSLENHSYSSNSNVCKCCGYTNNTTYTVTYNANGGTGAPASQTKQYNVTLKLSTVIPSKKGYTFLGWSTSATATSATYSAGGNYTKNSNCTLYAVWSSAVPKVIIDGTEIAPEYLRKEQTGVYAELYRLTSALNGSYTKNGNNATVKLYSEYYGEYLYFDYIPKKLTNGETFNVTVRNETNTLNFLTHGVYADGMIYGNVDLLAKAGNMQRSPDYDPINNCEYIGAFIKNSKLLDKKSTVSFMLGDVPGTTTISFEQGWLINDSKIYNHALAQFCSQFSMLGYEDDSYGKAVGVNSKTHLKTALESVGFELVDINMQTGRDEVNYFIATRQGMDLKTGKVYDVIFVGLIGSYKDQWYSDFDPWGIDRKKNLSNETKDTMHQGFLDAQNYVYTNLFEYMRGKYGEDFSKHNIKIVLTGHSRGAAAANLLGKQLIDNNLYTKKENIFTYAFATPRSVIDPNATSATYSRLFNIVNPEDFVTHVMPERWGFTRFGRTFKLPSKTNDKNYNSYLTAMNAEYAKFKKGQKYKPYENGEEETLNAIQALTIIDLNEFYYGLDLIFKEKIQNGKMDGKDYNYVTFYFLKFTLCEYLAKGRQYKDLPDLFLGSKFNNLSMHVQIFDYFSIAGGDTFNYAHQMETYCAYMLSMTESQIMEGEFGRIPLSVSVDCPVDVDIYDKQTGELVGRIRNNVIDETVAAKENAIVIIVDGDSKSFWLPSNGDYDVVLTGNDDGTMDYIVRRFDSNLSETERAVYFDVEVVKGVSMNSEFNSNNSTIDDFKLKDELGFEITPTEKLYKDGFNTVEIKTSVSGEGVVTNSFKATKGDYVKLSAYPNASLFVGWYNENGELVSSNIDYSFVAKENVSFTAKFTSFAIMTPSTTKISYGDSIILHADIKESLPTGSTIRWTADNDNFVYSASADGKTCTISPNKSGDTTFTVTVYDENENVIGTDTQIMTSKAGFFDKIIAFFKKLFGLTKTIPQSYKAVF